jgi:aryl-alcohol dehydrogenase-like predicted oxidoreductase
MQYITLGRTGLCVTRDAFGVLPLQRTVMPEAVRILHRAFDAGINFYDTARAYTDSEEKLGTALSEVRGKIIIASKTPQFTAAEVTVNLETTLKNLRTDYLDIYQFHNPAFVPDENHEAYIAVKRAQQEGKVRFIGFTNHRADVARKAVLSGLYDTLQFPLSYLSPESDIDLARLCTEKNIGFIAMKALSGGLLTEIKTARAWFGCVPSAVPIWGIQRMSELEQLIAAADGPYTLSPEQLAQIENDKIELGGDFCRGCGYCLPCPAEINIPWCARMPVLLRRMPFGPLIGEVWQGEMSKIENCTNCGHCAAHCPYGLDTPELLRKALPDYQAFLQSQK